MERFEIENSFSQLLPIQLEYHNAADEPSYPHWHSAYEFLFVLRGPVVLQTDNGNIRLEEDDVFLVNSRDAHRLSGDGEVLSLQFHPGKLPYFSGDSDSRFLLNSSGNTHSAKYDYVRYLMTRYTCLNQSGEHIYKSISLLYLLYSHLVENFLAPPDETVPVSRKNHQRITEIVSYIDAHYRDCLTMSAVASSFGFSAPYFSNFFEKNTGRTFMTYYNDIRLTHAVNEMLSTDESIETVALANGFGDVRSFVSLFKKQYGKLPSVYRKEMSREGDLMLDFALPAASADAVKKGSYAVEKALSFPNFMRYADIYAQNSIPGDISDASKMIEAGTLSYQAAGIGLHHNYRRMICVGSAKQFLYGDVQQMLQTVQREIGYTYVKFHGLLSDDMMVYSEDENGNPVYSWALIDKMLDFLMSIHLKPLCQLSFMPIQLASDPSRLMDFYHYNTSPPKDLDKWAGLITAFAEHVVDRYGAAEVQSWLFCVWNEPDETVMEFTFPSREEFFEFYRVTYQAVKGVDARLRFGTPSMLLSITQERGWAKDFFIYTNRHNCQPDFLNIHYYDNTFFDPEEAPDIEVSGEGFSASNMTKSFPLSDDPYAFMKFINNIKVLMKRYNMKSMPVYMTEWNLTVSHRDLINDTCFKSCYLIKNLLENYDRLESFAYWSLTDFIEELQLPNDLFHGGLGMFTYNGIPKPHYNAFRLLGCLQDEMIGKGDGYFITRGDRKLSLIVYNYEHYSKLFASGKRTSADLSNRYASFAMSDAARFTLTLTDIDEKYKSCLIKERFINQSYGSSFDAWIRMGAQPLSRDEDFDLLRQQSQPGMFLHRETIENGALDIQARIAPLEVRLIEIELFA